MHENYEIPHISDIDDSQFPSSTLEIVIEDGQDSSLVAITEEVDTSVIGVEEDRVAVVGLEEALVITEVPTYKAYVTTFLDPTEDKESTETNVPDQQGGVAETALSPDTLERGADELSRDTGVVEAQPTEQKTEDARDNSEQPEVISGLPDHVEELGERQSGPDVSHAAVSESSTGAELVQETLEVNDETEQRADALLAVVDQVTQDYFDEQDVPFVQDRNGIFVPARAENVLTCLRAADAHPGDVSLDIGSGDGRWPIVAGGLLGLEAHGYESGTDRHELALGALQKLTDQNLLTPQEAGNVHLVNRNFFDADISSVDVFSFYQGSGPAWRHIEHKLLGEGKPGARLILYGDLMNRETALEFVQTVPVSPPTNIYRIPEMRG